MKTVDSKSRRCVNQAGDAAWGLCIIVMPPCRSLDRWFIRLRLRRESPCFRESTGGGTERGLRSCVLATMLPAFGSLSEWVDAVVFPGFYLCCCHWCRCTYTLLNGGPIGGGGCDVFTPSCRSLDWRCTEALRQRC